MGFPVFSWSLIYPIPGPLSEGLPAYEFTFVLADTGGAGSRKRII